MSRIAIDCRFASIQGGLGTYVRGIVPELVHDAEHEHQFFLFVTDPSESWLSTFSSNPAVEIIPTPYAHYGFLEQLALPYLLWKKSIDLYFIPHFNAPLFLLTPCVVAIHDVILHQYPNLTSLYRRLCYRFLFWITVRRAKGIVTVSHTTEHDLSVLFPSTHGKVMTVYPGISSIFSPSLESVIAMTCKNYGIHQPYFMYIGNAKEHKNVQFLIDAFEASGLSNTSLILVTGGKEASLLRYGDSVRIVSPVPDDNLPHLLSGAIACVTASKKEGFCLPVVEAMACECPVVAPDIEPFPEVTKGHAYLIPLTQESFQDAFRRFRNVAISRSPERLLSAREFASSYSWKSSGQNLLSFLRRFLR